jgi:hypothetical protein
MSRPVQVSFFVMVAVVAGGCNTPTVDELLARAQRHTQSPSGGGQFAARRMPGLFAPVAEAYERVALNT